MRKGNMLHKCLTYGAICGTSIFCCSGFTGAWATSDLLSGISIFFNKLPGLKFSPMSLAFSAVSGASSKSSTSKFDICN